MCSRTFGPAIAPSLLTWPMTNAVIFMVFASCITAMVQSFTWPMLPGAEAMSLLYIVCTESMIRISGFRSSTLCVTALISVSARTKRSSLDTPSRCERILSWRWLSSPVTYRIFASGILPHICSSSVDFPMPGAPPTSTSEPRTAPPPRTRSISAMPVEKRISSSSSSCATGFGTLRRVPAIFTAALLAAALPDGAEGASTIVFHAPHAGQRPNHFPVSLPHSVQKNTLLAFIKRLSL